MLVSQGDVMIMWANPLVGSITTLALLMLVWPLISKALQVVRPRKRNELAEQQPLD